MSVYQHIARRANKAPMRQFCQVLRVTPAKYYAWRRRQQAPLLEPVWQVAIRKVFSPHSQRHGKRRLHAEVQAEGQPDDRGVPPRQLGETIAYFDAKRLYKP